ncbi:MAG TPA: type 1 glutamine amidotransferase domain-containing protein [Rhizomicrobium sp.]|jgi:putative intracellular protease/amidase|nr:type 1 glutamine amidotransferase domain-containing protein [Rhizomicrobium sp.]
MAHVLIPIPARDFDPTEVGVSWRILKDAGHRVSFATPDGRPGACDPIMLTGRGLDAWGFLPLLDNVRLFGLLLRANTDGRAAYRAMEQDAAFRNPLRWDALRAEDFDALLLGGGHRARGMRDYLESAELQRLVAAFFAAQKPVAAICHGVLLAARSKREDGHSVLYGRKTTALTWSQEKAASTLAHIGRFWDRNYYRTYLEAKGEPAGYMSVQQEVTRALQHTEDFRDVPRADPDFRAKTSGLARDTAGDSRPAFVVVDGRYVSARWPGDAHTFARTFAGLLA